MATATATAAPAPAPQLPGLSSSPTAEDRPAPLNQDQIEADDDTAEADSAFGSEIESSTTSLASSVKHYQYENGRQYHAYKSGHYAFPNDEAELDRLDLQHHIFTLTLNGRLHLAPIQSPQRIIDLGTGTGIWAIDMADLYPSAQVTGVDLSPSQPEWVPPNVQFEVDDIESQWTFKEDLFDFTYARCMIGSISDWLLLFQRAFKHTKPGGWFELCEYDPRFVSDDGSLAPDSHEKKWSTLMCEASEKYGRPVPHYPEYKHLFEGAGFVDVHEEVFKVPSSPWPKEARLKEIGKFQHLQYLEGLKGLTIGLFTRSLQWQPEEVEVFLAHMRGELKDRSIHSYQNIVVVYGRKPQETSKAEA